MLEVVVEMVEVLGAALGPVFAEVSDWRDRLEATLAGGDTRVTELDETVEWLVAPALDDDRPMIGAGFVSAPGLLEEAPWHMAWWLGAANGVGLGGRPGSLRRLVSIENPMDESFHDYTRLEWWRIPAETGRPHLTGPYIDYLCTDELTLTLTMPVRSGDALAGMVGADLSVASLERLTDHVLRDAGVPAVLGTSAGRIVAASDATLEPGTPARRVAWARDWHPVPGCDGTLVVSHAG